MSSRIPLPSTRPAVSHGLPLHDPSPRSVALRTRGWEVRTLTEPCGRRDDAHVQLWNPRAGVSVITPCRLTDGRFEVFDGTRCRRLARPAFLHPELARLCSGELPAMREIALFVAWFARPQRRR